MFTEFHAFATFRTLAVSLTKKSPLEQEQFYIWTSQQTKIGLLNKVAIKFYAQLAV